MSRARLARHDGAATGILRGVARFAREEITHLLEPASVAVIGASERPYSRNLFTNLESAGFRGPIHAVNPRRTSVMGRPSLDSIHALESPVDCAVVLVGRDSVEEAATDAIESGMARSLIIPTGGLAESGEQRWIGVERRLKLRALEHRVPLLGTNTVGAHSGTTSAPLMITPLPEMPPGGTVALLMQSGGSLAGTMRYLTALGIPVGHAVSVGNGTAVGLSEWLWHLVDRDDVKAIAMLIEGIDDWALFRAAAERARDMGKPVAAVKVGSSEAGRLAAQSHTGALAGDHRIYAGALRQVGVRLAETPGELAAWLGMIHRFGMVGTGNLGVVAISGGAAGQVSDMCGKRNIPLASLAAATIEAIDGGQTGLLVAQNPLDLSPAGSMDPDAFVAATDVFVQDPAIAAILYVHAQVAVELDIQAHLEATVAAAAGRHVVPVIVSQLMYSNPDLLDLREAGGYDGAALAVPSLVDAIGGLALWFGYRDTTDDTTMASPAAPGQVLWKNEADLKHLLEDAGLRIPAYVVLGDLDEEIELPEGPYAVKALGPEVWHKARSGLVELGVRSRSAVATAARTLVVRASRIGMSLDGVLVESMVPRGVDLFVSIWRDPLGDVVMLGGGGTAVEEASDRVAVGIHPVDAGWVRAALAYADAVAYAEPVMECLHLLHAVYTRHGLASLECNPVRVLGDGSVYVLDAVATAAENEGQGGDPASDDTVN